MRRVLILTSALLMTLTVVGVPAAAGGGGPYCDATGYSKKVSGPTATVPIESSCFRPTVLYVDEGTEVTFENLDPVPHNISGPPGSFAEGLYRDIKPGEEYMTLLQTSGVFPYMCYFHPGMAGVIIVGDGRGAMDVGSQDIGLEVDEASGVTTGGRDGGSTTPALAVGFGIAMVLLIAAVARLATRKAVPTAS